jgi:hypothetical protein
VVLAVVCCSMPPLSRLDIYHKARELSYETMETAATPSFRGIGGQLTPTSAHYSTSESMRASRVNRDCCGFCGGCWLKAFLHTSQIGYDCLLEVFTVRFSNILERRKLSQKGLLNSSRVLFQSRVTMPYLLRQDPSTAYKIRQPDKRRRGSSESCCFHFPQSTNIRYLELESETYRINWVTFPKTLYFWQ